MIADTGETNSASFHFDRQLLDGQSRGQFRSDKSKNEGFGPTPPRQYGTRINDFSDPGNAAHSDTRVEPSTRGAVSSSKGYEAHSGHASLAAVIQIEVAKGIDEARSALSHLLICEQMAFLLLLTWPT